MQDGGRMERILCGKVAGSQHLSGRVAGWTHFLWEGGRESEFLCIEHRAMHRSD